MAKGNFLTSTVKGKLGEMVGYKNTNSNDKVKQAWRSYVPHISNPRTEGQARQRMIVSNLTQNYTALKEIISRGFEGIKYGGKSYQRFLSLNMKNAGNGPYIPKGTRSTPLPIPGMQISEGSLISITTLSIVGKAIQVGSNSYNLPFIVTDLYNGNVSIRPEDMTWGQMSQQLIRNNTDIKDGDQLTIVTVSVTENLEYVYRYKSVIIDSGSTETLGVPHSDTPFVRSFGDIMIALDSDESGMRFCFSIVDIDYDEVNVAGAVIQSRLGNDGKWLRSTASLYVNTQDEEIMQYFTDEMFQNSLESYMGTGSSRSSDWPTEPDASVISTWAKSLTRADFMVEETGHTAFVASLVSSDFKTIKYIVRTENNVQYLTNLDGSVYKYNDTPVPASALSGISATRELVDINGLAEYNISNLRAAAPELAEEVPDTRKKSKK